MKSIYVLTLDLSDEREMICIPNTELTTITHAINQLYKDENYLSKNCREFEIDNEHKFGEFYDQVQWRMIGFQVDLIPKL